MLKKLSKAGLLHLMEPDSEKRATKRSPEPPQYTYQNLCRNTAGGWRKNTQGMRGYSSLMLSTFDRPFPFLLVLRKVGTWQHGVGAEESTEKVFEHSKLHKGTEFRTGRASLWFNLAVFCPCVSLFSPVLPPLISSLISFVSLPLCIRQLASSY